MNTTLGNADFTVTTNQQIGSDLFQGYLRTTPTPTTYITTTWPEGEVKVLREIVTALVAASRGRSTTKPRRKTSSR